MLEYIGYLVFAGLCLSMAAVLFWLVFDSEDAPYDETVLRLEAADEYERQIGGAA